MKQTTDPVARFLQDSPPVTQAQIDRLRDLLPPVEMADKPKPRPKPSPKPKPSRPSKPPKYGAMAS